MTLIHHKTLTGEKWASYTFYKQILMVGNELNRAKNMILRKDTVETEKCYERALELVDLTISLLPRKNVLKELLRFRELLAGTYVTGKYEASNNDQLYRGLLSLNPESYLLLN